MTRKKWKDTKNEDETLPVKLTKTGKIDKSYENCQKAATTCKSPVKTCTNLQNRQKPANTKKTDKNHKKHEQNYKSTPEISQNFDPFKPTHPQMMYVANYRFNNMLFGSRICVAFTKRYGKVISAHYLYTRTPPTTYTSAKMLLMIILNQNIPQPWIY